MKKYLVFLMAFVIAPLLSQNFNGTANYSSMSTVTTTIGDASATAQEQKDLNEQIRKAMQKEYKLDFNKKESLFSEVEKLDAPDGKKGIEVIGVGSTANGGLYKNIYENRCLESRDCFGKLFLIDKPLEHYNWILEEETRQVGDYSCNKASIISEKKIIANEIDEKGQIVRKEKTIKTIITAWYTMQIPVNQGPAAYWGLPGLIIELNDGMMTYICTSIVLNKEGLKIEKPKRGKKITNEKFDEMYQRKIQELQEMYTDQRKKGDD